MTTDTDSSISVVEWWTVMRLNTIVQSASPVFGGVPIHSSDVSVSTLAVIHEEGERSGRQNGQR